MRRFDLLPMAAGQPSRCRLTLRHRGQAPSHIDRIPPIDRRGKWHLVMYPQLLADDREWQHVGAGGVGECEYAGRSPINPILTDTA